MCLLEEALLREEWYSMYTVSSAPDMELMVPARRDTCKKKEHRHMLSV